jgi:hypothetical protein
MTHTDPRLEVLAQRYRSEAAFCLDMAELADSALRKKLILAAARWIKLEQEAKAGKTAPKLIRRPWANPTQ